MQETQGLSLATVIVIVSIGGVFVISTLVLVFACFKKVEQGQALIINKVGGEPVVTFAGGLVLPMVHMAEFMDITMKVIHIECHGRDGLRFADGKTRDVSMRFYVRINNQPDDILRVARALGAQRAGQLETLEELFVPRLLEAMKVAARKLPAAEFEDHLTEFRDQVLVSVGADLQGYVLDDAVVDFTHQAKVSVAYATDGEVT